MAPGPRSRVLGRRAALVVLSVGLQGVVAGGVAPGDAGATTGASRVPSADARRPARPDLAKSGRAAFWECPAKTTELLVAVNTLTLHPGATLDVSFTVKNGGPVSCNYTAPYASVEPGPTSSALQAGPCGSVGFEILDRRHHEVWPGPQVVHCPALGFAELAPGATVSGAGTWDQTRPNSTSRVRPGRFTLVVQDKHFSFPLRVLGS